MEKVVKLIDDINEYDALSEYKFVCDEGVVYTVKSSFVIGIPYKGCYARINYVNSMGEYVAIINDRRKKSRFT